jgi:hypothetical protein
MMPQLDDTHGPKRQGWVASANGHPDFGGESSDRAKAFVDSCMADEKTAQEKLAQDWEKFALDIRQTCLGTATSIAGIQGYVELLSCIEMGTAAKKMLKN